ncbi:MAG: AsmA family protein [Acidocella sp.]|nr:AsmA family protein [Acidocella sp.]
MSEDERPRPRRRAVTWAIMLAVLVGVPVLVLGVIILRFNPDAYAPALVAAVHRATGRVLTINGPIHVAFSLTPTIEADDITLSNPPGFADANLMSLARVKARVALLPLLSHRVDISALVLEDPRIYLERNAAGVADWDLSGRHPADIAGHGTAGGARPASGYKVALAQVDIHNAAVMIRGTKAGPGISLTLPSLTGTAASFIAPLHITAQALLGSAPVGLTGVVGPISRLTTADGAPWPVDLTLTLGGAQAVLHGVIAHPRSANGYDFTLGLTIPALETLAASLPGVWQGGITVPPIHNISAQARIMDQESTIPAVDGLSVKAGASGLSVWRPGLALTGLDVEMASLDQPVRITATGSQNGMALSLNGTLGPPQALFNPMLLPATMPPQGSYPVAIQAQAGAASLVVKGAIATPAALAGVAIGVTANIPDLAGLSPLAGMALPAWTHVSVQTTMVDPGGLGLRAAIGFQDLAISLDNAAFGGDVSLYFGAHPRLQAAIRVSNLDVDALRAAMPAATPMPPATATPTQPTTAWPDWVLPVGLMRTASADIQMAADRVVWDKAVYTALQGHAVLGGGVLSLNPLTGELPGGSINATGVINASQSPAAESVQIKAPALAMAPFLRALGLPGAAEGIVQAQLSATSTGDDLPDMAAHLGGQLGLASVNDVVDARVMNQMFGAMVRAVGLPSSLVNGQGPVAVRCLGVRVDATNGVGTIRALTLDSNRLLVQGGGSLDFANQTLDVVLSPQFSLAGSQLGVPVRLTGAWNDPSSGLAPARAVAAAAKAAVGLPVGVTDKVLGGNSVLGQIAGSLGIGPQADVCPAALSLGRLGQPGPAAPKPASSTNTVPGTGTAKGPQNLLNALFGK